MLPQKKKQVKFKNSDQVFDYTTRVLLEYFTKLSFALTADIDPKRAF